MPFRARVSPRFGYGMDPHTLTEVEAGVVFTSASLTLGLSATVPVEHDGRDVTAEFKLAEGESAVFALDEVSGGAVPRACSGAGGGGAGGRHRRVLAELAVGVALPRPVAGDGAPLRADAEAAHLRARPARSWPRRRPACPSRSAGSATGTTGTSGSATRPSASTHCCGSVSPARPRRSCNFMPERTPPRANPVRLARCR